MQVAQQRDIHFALRCRLGDGAACTENAFGGGDRVDGRPRAGSPFASRASRGSRCSTVCRSARISSVLTVSMSPGRVHPRVDMDDVVVVEGAHHLADGVRLPDGRQELVAQALPLGRAADEPCDVHEGHRRRYHRRAVVEIGQLLQPRIGHGHHAHVGLNGGEGVVRRQHLVVGQRVEERGLAHVGQPDDADRKAHPSGRLAREEAGVGGQAS